MFGNAIGYRGFEMCVFWYVVFEFQKAGPKGGMRDWEPPLLEPHLKTYKGGGWGKCRLQIWPKKSLQNVENGQKNIVELQKFRVLVDVEFSEKKVVECRIW